MSVRLVNRWPIAVLVLCLFAPPSVLAQTIEHQDNDTVQPGPGAPAPVTSSVDLSRAADQVVTYTNQFRARHGRGELNVNPRLSRAAQNFAEYLARTDSFSHTADGQNPSQRISEQGYQFCIAAENIGMQYNSAGFATPALAQAFVRSGRHSPEHRKNMLDRDLDDIGVGVAYSARTGRYYAVQDFGRPRSRAIAFKITNDSDAPMHYLVAGKSFTIDPHYTITHRRCRSAELDFQEAHRAGAASGNREATFHPRNGDQFVIQGDQPGGYVVDLR